MSVPRKLRCRVDHITDHGDKVYSVELEPETKPPAFRPGQFLHLALDEYDPSRFWPESRVFSIASSPSTLPLRISYSVRGRYTARMEQELTVGRQVWIKLPYGEFVVSPTQPSVLLAGGTGITAFTAFIAGMKPDHLQPVFVAYGARTPELLIYRNLVEQQAAAVPSFRYAFFSDSVALVQPSSLIPRPGPVSVATIWPLLATPAGSSFFVSGPPAMLKSVAADLQDRGILPTAIHTDAWE
ncbi:FAD-dependent oxidoreductase [candidate division WOR-3 bacterium]|uniref:FAD-dependent oxidoreductase n=1 Tax=candidate division WOR-3 bacterium TaxID=2052148 RepID=A0A938BUU0_UNCW3|nr:FAD-dependent oxidoreductase [candidate division WOR-3 bacterium]